ncbi:conserved membrane protein of unknown function [Nitrospira sp. KM1]|uniref:SxtJ family membrane protein n=1 Tax=Nitrospira sp. KM1 TaxID=1936990 RepID=UPI0013A72263|nr:SxtJ family membrane protein [Nitrospira sp. KM1]BCA54104.1 conserved membrane protein of unknown function [Nitrospira sp. KM1]
MIQQPETKQLRDFGLMVGGIFLFIGIWPLIWRGDDVRLWAIIVGGSLVPLGLVMPSLLAPVFKGWMAIGHVLGWINTRIILGVLYYGMVVPMGLVMSAMGRDPMRRSWDSTVHTYRVIREPRAPSHMKNMF